MLGIAVDADTLDRWHGWLMPAEQPFLVPRDVADATGLADDRERLTLELTDSFWLYDRRGRAVCWLTRKQALRLPPVVRRAQPAAHHWPSPDYARDIVTVVRVVENHRHPDRHPEVAPATWERASAVLPSARLLAGSFPDRSGPNCLGTVMGAAGVAGAAQTWMQPGPFEEWLAAAARPGGRDHEAGTLLVWRDADQGVQHAAVTLGDGWALDKPSQGWMSPTRVLAVRDAIASARVRGHHLQRRTLQR